MIVITRALRELSDTPLFCRLLALLMLLACVGIARQARAAEPAREIHQLQRAALSYHGLSDVSHHRAIRRARLSNLVPRLELRSTWQRQLDDQIDYREDQVFDELGAAARDTARNDLSTGRAARDTYGVQLQFDLGGLIFDRRELDLARLSDQRQEDRRKVLAQVNRVYFDLRRHERELELLPEDDLEERLVHEVEAARCEADLDALTGGWYSRHRREAPRQGGEE